MPTKFQSIPCNGLIGVVLTYSSLIYSKYGQHSILREQKFTENNEIPSTHIIHINILFKYLQSFPDFKRSCAYRKNDNGLTY